MTNGSFRRRICASAVILIAVGLAACKSNSDEAETVTSETLTVVGLDNTESRLLTEIYAQALEQAGMRIARRDPVADLTTAYATLKNGGADVFLSHTNELLTYLVQAEPAAAASTSTTEATTTTAASTTIAPESTSPATTGTPTTTSAGATTTTAGAGLESTTTTIPSLTSTTSPVPQAGEAAAVSINLQTNQIGEILPSDLQIGAASNAENKNVIVCNGVVAQTMQLVNLSQVAKLADTIRIAGTADFETGDPFGLPGFEKKYGATFKEFVPVEAGKVGDAISPPEPNPDESTTTSSTVATSDQATTTTAPAPLDIDAECGAFNSLDVTIPQTAVLMDDDQTWITTNGVIPLLSMKAYTPGASQIIDQVSQALHTNDLRTMITAVDVNKIDVNVVASNFLSTVGIGGG
jgi:glycine betaine/choline ABC-type transport system substrate-binding protein